jgi:ABC-type multidrug transport system ATPase subunit
MTGYIHKLRDSGCTILMSLHGESEMARLATRAIQLESGSVIADTRRGAMFQSIFAGAVN